MALSSDALRSFKSETIRGAPGFYRVGQSYAGQWWLIGPDDEPFFARAVNGVAGSSDATRDSLARLRSWGFNSLGANAAPALNEEGLPFVGTVNFAASARLIRAKSIRLPDVFDSDWPAVAQQRAGEVCPTGAERRELIGWLADDDLGWGGSVGSDGPSLLQICLSLEPGYAAYHAAWEFVLAPHGGAVGRLGKAWGCSLENKEVLRELTRAERGLATSAYLRDNARWTQEFARRYFAVTSAAIRAHDPHHLILGARDPGHVSARKGAHGWLGECRFPAVDVAWVHTDDVTTAADGPLFAGNFCWAHETYWTVPPRSRTRGVTSVERMLRQGRASLRATLSHPSVVGYAWEAWSDGPGEQPPFARGLVHRNEEQAREHTELLTDLNRRFHALRPFAGRGER